MKMWAIIVKRIFFFKIPAISLFVNLSLLDALPICVKVARFHLEVLEEVPRENNRGAFADANEIGRAHVLQSHSDLVCRLLLEKKKAGNNWGVAGGGYLRLLPYRPTHWAIRHINNVE